jgi:hypothetical protein
VGLLHPLLQRHDDVSTSCGSAPHCSCASALRPSGYAKDVVVACSYSLSLRTTSSYGW